MSVPTGLARLLRRFRRLLDYALSFLVDALVSLIKIPTAPDARLLLVRVDSIGDFIIWLDTAKEYRKRYPNHRITLCVNSLLREFSGLLPYWDELLVVNLKRLNSNAIYRYQVLAKTRRLGSTIAVQPSYSRVYLEGDALIRATGAAHRIGSEGNTSNMPTALKKIADRWYTQLIPAAYEPMMELERNAEFIRGLDHSSGSVAKPQLEAASFSASLPIWPVQAASTLLVPARGPYFVIFPGASWVGRQWPASRFAEVIASVHQQTQWLPVLCGSAAERDLCQQIIDLCGLKSCINLVGATELADLAEVLRSAQGLVTNETSAVHMAAAVGTPAVCIVGGGHFGRFMPYPTTMLGIKPTPAVHPMPCFNCNWHCNQPHTPGGAVPCISGVSVAQVLALFYAATGVSSEFFAARETDVARTM